MDHLRRGHDMRIDYRMPASTGAPAGRGAAMTLEGLAAAAFVPKLRHVRAPEP